MTSLTVANSKILGYFAELEFKSKNFLSSQPIDPDLVVQWPNSREKLIIFIDGPKWVGARSVYGKA